ncbi:MAG: ABC transporter ATP-binding protein, partial [Acidimicrobiia bacterium]
GDEGAAALAGALAERGVPATAVEGLVEVTVRGDDDLDAVRDTVAALGLPLYRLSSRAGSLDEAFLTPRAPVEVL